MSAPLRYTAYSLSSVRLRLTPSALHYAAVCTVNCIVAALNTALVFSLPSTTASAALPSSSFSPLYCTSDTGSGEHSNPQAAVIHPRSSS